MATAAEKLAYYMVILEVDHCCFDFLFCKGQYCNSCCHGRNYPRLWAQLREYCSRRVLPNCHNTEVQAICQTNSKRFYVPKNLMEWLILDNYRLLVGPTLRGLFFYMNQVLNDWLFFIMTTVVQAGKIQYCCGVLFCSFCRENGIIQLYISPRCFNTVSQCS